MLSMEIYILFDTKKNIWKNINPLISEKYKLFFFKLESFLTI